MLALIGNLGDYLQSDHLLEQRFIDAIAEGVVGASRPRGPVAATQPTTRPRAQRGRMEAVTPYDWERTATARDYWAAAASAASMAAAMS